MAIISKFDVGTALSTYNSNHNMASVNITDSSDNIATNLGALTPLVTAGKIIHINQMDSPIPLTINDIQLLKINASVFRKISSNYTLVITDSANNITGNLDTLKSYIRKITSINQTTTSPLTLTAAQLNTYKAVITKIVDDYSLIVTETPTSRLITLSTNPRILSFGIKDTAFNINKLSSLTAIINLDSKVTSITQTGAPKNIVLTVSQYSPNLTQKFTNFKATISNANTLIITDLLTDSNIDNLNIRDSSSNIATSLDTLQALGIKVTTITQTGTSTALTITGNQFINDSLTLNKIQGRYSLIINDASAALTATLIANTHVKTFTVSDTASNIHNNLSALLSAGTKLTSITESGPVAPITMLANQYNKFFTGKLTNFTATVLDAPTRLVASLNTDAKISSITVKDNTKNISSNLDILQAINAKLISITQTDLTTPLTIRFAQLTNDTSAIEKISISNPTYQLIVIGVSVTNIRSTLSNEHVKSISVLDSGNNIANNLNSIQDFINSHSSNSYISRIVLSDSPTTLTITESQLSQDSSALELITSNGYMILNDVTIIDNGYSLIITEVRIADLASIITNPLVNRIAITDTALNITENIATIKENLSVINSITISDNPTALTLTKAQLSENPDLLALILGPYTLKITDVLVSDINTDLENPLITNISITDESTNVLSNLDLLKTNISLITAINLLDTPESITISATQITNYLDIFALLNTYPFLVTEVSIADISTVLAITWVTSLSILDSADNIQTNLDTLQTEVVAGHISSITTPDVKSLAISYTQFTNVPDALNILNRDSFTFTVSDVAIADSATVLDTAGVISIAILDNASNIQSNLDTLQSEVVAGHISSIKSTDATSLAITHTQFTNDLSALTLLQANGFTFTVSDVAIADSATVLDTAGVISIAILDNASNIQTNLDTLQSEVVAGHISGITISNSPQNLTISYTQLINDVDVLFLLSSSSYTLTVSNVPVANINDTLAANGVVSITVSDNATNIKTNLDALQTAVTAGTITDISINNGPQNLTITYTQYTADTGVLALLETSSYTLTVSDVAVADISSVLGNTAVTDITVNDIALTIITNLDSLQVDVTAGHINDITLNDGSTSTPASLTISYTQLVNDAGALALIDSSTYTLNVSNVPVNKITTVLAISNVTTITVSDTAATINANLNTLQTEVAASHINGITLNDVTAPAKASLVINYTQLINDAGTLALLNSNSFTLTVSNVPVANITDTLNTTGVTSITVTDSATTINTNLNTLQTAVTAGTITDISINNGPQNLTITYTQYTADTGVLALLETSSYTLTVTDVAVADISSVLLNNAVTGITVNDSALTIITNLDSLQVDVTAGQIKDITLNDGSSSTPGSLAISYTQLVNDAGALALIDSSTYTLNVSNVPVNKITTILAISNVTTITVSDTTATINANLNTLQTEVAASHINGITLNDVTAPAKASLVISYTQLSNDTGTLALLDTSTYTLTVSNVLVANIANVTTMTDTFGATALTRITVSDSAANIKTNLDALQTDVASGKITDISINNGPQNLTISYTQYTADTGTLALLETSSYTLTINDVAVADISTITSNSLIKSINILDSSSHITSNLNTLQANTTLINSISFTDAPTNLSITPAQLTADTNILDLISATNANILFNVDLGASGVVSNLDTSNGHINLIFNSNTTGTPSDTNFETINHFSSKDVISFSSGLTIDNKSSETASGVAFIDNTTGIATFDISDISLQQQIVAVENAINMGFSSTAGNVAYWTNGNDSYAFITDNTIGVSSGDNLIKFIGIDISHLVINTGTIVYI